MTKLTEIDLIGVYVAPIALLAFLAWILLLLGRRLVMHSGAQPHVGHPPLFGLALYIIVLSILILAVGP